MGKYTKEELEARSVVDLRILARGLFGGGTWTATANKRTLINAILHGVIPGSAGAVQSTEEKMVVAFSAMAKIFAELVLVEVRERMIKEKRGKVKR